MPEPKTRPEARSAEEFIGGIDNERRREDAVALDAMMRSVSGYDAVMWGPSIIGYGEVQVTNASGKSYPWPVIAFSPRKANLVIYLDTTIEEERLEALGPHRRGASCLYLKKLSDADPDVLRDVLARSIELSQG